MVADPGTDSTAATGAMPNNFLIFIQYFLLIIDR